MFVGKLMALFSHSIASLVMAECACAIMIFTFLLMFSLWFVLTHVFQLAHFFQHFPFIGMVVVSLDLMLLMRSLLLSELISPSILAAVFSGLSTSCWSSSLLPPSKPLSFTITYLQLFGHKPSIKMISHGQICYLPEMAKD